MVFCSQQASTSYVGNSMRAFHIVLNPLGYPRMAQTPHNARPATQVHSTRARPSTPPSVSRRPLVLRKNIPGWPRRHITLAPRHRFIRLERDQAPRPLSHGGLSCCVRCSRRAPRRSFSHPMLSYEHFDACQQNEPSPVNAPNCLRREPFL